MDAWDKSLHAYGTSYLYENRYKRYKRYLNWLNFLGLLVPIVIGAALMGYGKTSSITEYALIVGTPLAIIQLVGSLAATATGWPDSLAYSSESKSSNYDLFRSFESFAKTPPSDDQSFVVQYSVLKTMEQAREQQDANHPTSAKENREGMRCALIYFRRQCATCGQTPTTMKPTDCDTCGNF